MKFQMFYMKNVDMVQADDDIFLCLGDWSGGYDTEMLSDSEDEVESWVGCFIEGEEINLLIVFFFSALTCFDQ